MLDEMLMEIYPDYLNDNGKIAIYKKIAIDICLNYFQEHLNIDITREKLEEEYASAIFLMITNACDFEKTRGLKSIKQGNKSISYNTYDNKMFVLTPEIVSMFPVPRVVFKG